MVAMTVNFPTTCVRKETPRGERLTALKQYFLDVLLENPQNNTPFDDDVLTTIERLEEIYGDDDKIQSALDSETQITKEQRIDEILATSREKTITEEEYNELRELLSEKYFYGNLMREYLCPKCDRPLLLSWAYGVICPHPESGCGWQLSVERSNEN